MSKPRYIWWGYAKGMVRQYPALKKEYDALQDFRSPGSVIVSSGGGSPSRTAENAALRRLPRVKQSEYDAVEKAIERTKALKTGPERLALIDLVYWKKTSNLDGAAYRLHFSTATAYRYHKEFIGLVGYCRGLVDEDIKEN